MAAGAVVTVCSMACVSDDVCYVTGQAGTGSMVGRAAVATDQRFDLGGNYEIAASIQVIRLRFLGWSIGWIRRDAGIPATISVMLL